MNADTYVYRIRDRWGWQAAPPLGEQAQEGMRELPGLQVQRNGARGAIPTTAIASGTAMAELYGASIRLTGLDRRCHEEPRIQDGPDPIIRLKPGFWSDWARPFQIEAVATRVESHGGLIWAAPGSGKTFMALAWLGCWPHTPSVVVTRSGARLQWASEVEAMTTYGPHPWTAPSRIGKRYRPLSEYMAAKAESWERWILSGENPGDRPSPPFIVVAWENLRGAVDEILAALTASPWGSSGYQVVFDEIHRGKQKKRLKWFVGADDKLQSELMETQAGFALKLAESARRALGTTATPVANRTIDLYGQFALIEPECWGKTSKRFAFRYCDARPNPFGGLDDSGTSNLDELIERIAPMVHQIPFEVSHGELPSLRRRVYVVPQERQVKADFSTNRELAKLGKEYVSGDEDRRASVGARITEVRLMEACSRIRQEALAIIKESAEVGKGKVVAFFGRVAECEAMAAQVLRSGAFPGGVFVGHGELSAEDREATRKAYMAATEPAALIATWQSFGESLNLHDSDRLIWAMLPWTPLEIEQGEGRVYRLGMKRPVEVIYLVGEGTFAERVRTVLLDKLPAVKALQPGTAIAGLSASFKDREQRAVMVRALIDELMDERARSGDVEEVSDNQPSYAGFGDDD